MPRSLPISRNDTFDVCVIGGGPAGASLALRLTMLGRKVALIEKAKFPREHIGESLAGGILPLFETLEVREDLTSDCFLAAPSATVLWAGQLRHYDRLQNSIVDRGKFDELLMDAARRAGVIVYQPSRVVETSFNTRWVIKLSNGETIHSQILANATGRSSAHSIPKTNRGPQTLAIYSYWANVRTKNTFVEAGESYWLWAGSLPNGKFNVTIFVDRGDLRVDGYLGLIRKSKVLGQLMDDASYGEIHACLATPAIDQSPISDRLIKVGDAAIAIDPLSSQGVQTAIGTALHAAVVINTILDRPDDAQLAMDFYVRRIRDSSNFHMEAAAQLYRQQLAVTPTDFWRKRAAVQIGQTPELKEPLRPNDRVRVSARVSFAMLPIATSSHIVRTDGVQWNGKIGVFVGGTSISMLLKQIDSPMLAGECVQRWCQTMPYDKAMQAIQWAWNEELIEFAH